MTVEHVSGWLWKEYQQVEAERLSIIKDVFDVCRAMHAIQKKLADNMLQVLVENAWKESEVTRNLAAATVLLLKSVAGLERKNSAEAVFLSKLEPVEDDPSWDSQIGTAWTTG